MKAHRIWLPLLLAVLLPVRGAMAAAMLCAPAGVGAQSEVRVKGHPVGHHGQAGGHHSHASHDHGSHEHGAPARADATSAETPEGGTSGGTPDESDKCNVCSAFCSVASLVNAAPTLPASLPMAPTVFPALAAPAPLFLSGGQDRPPRSI